MATNNLHSSGRGGAGNIVDSTRSPKLQPQDLETPTLKTSVVTTGRGGTGNMAKNNDPVETRLRQDVTPITRKESTGATHIGRGGNGNVARSGADEVKAGKKEGDKASPAPEDVAQQGKSEERKSDEKKGEERGWTEKGKNLLFGKK